ncbi:hypothetical protein MKW92_017612 [Papaver armeniacum]|nr:hypothetical protein MKW92_017612 [Papaver armeniacum]
MDSLLLGAHSKPSSHLSCRIANSFDFSKATKSWRCDAFKAVQYPSVGPVQISRSRARNVLCNYSIGSSQRYPISHFVKSSDEFIGRSCKNGPVNAASGQSLESEPEESGNNKSTQKPLQTTLSIISVSLLAVERLSDVSPLFLTGVLEVNKPYLPLASGEYSVRTGIMIVTSFAAMSFGLGWVIGSWPLFWALFVSFILGTAYSIDLPFLRWKRFALVAAMCILAVRAVIVQLAFFLHMQTFVYRRPVFFTRPLIFATAFMSFFSVVIALFKDIPDIVGDKIFGIRSFTVRLGQERVFWICVYLLEMAYAVAILVGASSSSPWSKLVTVLGHIILASVLWLRAKSIDLKSKTAITSFYMFIWQLFYAEYLLIPLVR